MRTRLIRLSYLAVLMVVASVWFATPASAHSALQASTPAPGETVPTSPGAVTLRFNEPVTSRPDSIRLLDARGEEIDISPPTAVDTVVSAEVPDLENGSYVVAWKVMSADSHPVTGAFTFAVGAPSVSTADAEALAADAADAAEDEATRVLADASSGLVYAGVLLAVGAAVFAAFVVRSGDHGSDALIRIGTLLGVTGAVVTVPAEAMSANGKVGLPSLSDLGDQLSGAAGAQLLLVLLGLGVVVSTTWMRPDRRPGVLVTDGAMLAAAGLAAIGHTRSATPLWLSVSADMAHVLAAAVWSGGVAALLLFLRSDRSDRSDRSERHSAAAPVIARFSTLATGAIVVVAVAGVLLGWRIVPSWGALTSTTYGVLLLVKVALVGVVAAIGAFNHFSLVGRAEEGRLRSTLVWEGATMVAVLAVTSVLTSTSPNEASLAGSLSAQLTCEEVAAMQEMGGMDEMDHTCEGEPADGRPSGGEEGATTVPFDPTRAAQGAGVSVTDEFGGGLARVTVSPAAVGHTTISIQLTDENGAPIDALEPPVVELRLRERDIGPISVLAGRVGAGAYRIRENLVLPGTWEVNVSAVVSDFEQPQSIVEVEIRP